MVSIKVCSLEELPAGSMKKFSLKEKEVLIINSHSGLSGLDARCTHAGAPLEEGTLEGETLTCPWHGSQFRITDGAVIRGPAARPLATFTETIKEGWVFIEL